MYKVLFGKEPSEEIINQIKTKISTLKTPPHLVIILVGDDPASELYVKRKLEKATSIGIIATLKKFPAKTTESELLKTISELNSDKSVDGFIVQAPLPKHINQKLIIEAISPNKDVDGWTSSNMGRIFVGLNDAFFPATPQGIIKMLDYYKFDLKSKNVVVIGRSNVVGKPLALLLLEKDATVTVCHSKTRNLAEFTKIADIIIVAAGKAHLLNADMIREGATVIDVGTNRIGDKAAGDADFSEIIKKANCSPVPGGVGPMTVAMLMFNVTEAAIRRNK